MTHPASMPRGEEHYAWKGAEAGLIAIHKFIRSRFVRPDHCEICGTNEARFHWANISGKYSRERSDWLNLCPSCHMKFDHNPDYMKRITQENCVNGHEFDGRSKPTKSHPNGQRTCSECRRESTRRYREKRHG